MAVVDAIVSILGTDSFTDYERNVYEKYQQKAEQKIYFPRFLPEAGFPDPLSKFMPENKRRNASHLVPHFLV